MSAHKDRDQYVAAMVSGNIALCSRIEQRHDLYGYPPELVCVGLSAICEGKDAHEAVDAYTTEQA